MKKILICAMAAVLCVFYIPYTKTYAAEEEFNYPAENFDIDAFLNEFSTGYINRSTKSPAEELAAATFIADKFLELNLTTSENKQAVTSADYLQSFSFTNSQVQYSSNNVVAVKPAKEESSLNVIIAAHYDNVYDYTLKNPYTNVNYNTLSNGAYDNGSGVSVMMSAAYNLKDAKLPYNIIFIAFGAEEMGMYGSREYVGNMNSIDKENTLLMINLDSISAGDYIYLFTQDWKTEHDSYLRKSAEELHIPLRNLPFDKKYMSDPFDSKYYSHIGYYSDNYFFLQEGINSAFFLSINFESTKKAGVIESDYYADIIHTSDDNYSNLKELYPDTYLLYMQYVSQIITNTLLKPDFVSAMQESSKNSPDYSFITNDKYLTVIAIGLWLVFAVMAYIYYGKLKKISDKKVKEYLSDPKNLEKINVIFKGFQNMPPFKSTQFTYPPHTYKPKDGEDEFSVFGKDYENPENKKDKENKDKDKK